jgi:hypothetical protein
MTYFVLTLGMKTKNFLKLLNSDKTLVPRVIKASSNEETRNTRSGEGIRRGLIEHLEKVTNAWTISNTNCSRNSIYCGRITKA